MKRYLLPGERPRSSASRLVTRGLVACLLLVVLCLCWIWFLPRLVVAQLASAAGVRATVGSATFNPFNGRLSIGDLHVASPTGFASGDALHLRRLQAELSTTSLLTASAEVATLVVDVETCTVATDAQEAFNWGTMATNLRRADRSSPPWSLAPLALVRSKTARIASLEVKLERLRVVDGGREPPRVAHFRVALDERVQGSARLRDTIEDVAMAGLAATARSALDTDNRESVRILSRVARELGARTRNRDLAVDNLLQQVWPNAQGSTDQNTIAQPIDHP